MTNPCQLYNLMDYPFMFLSAKTMLLQTTYSFKNIYAWLSGFVLLQHLNLNIKIHFLIGDFASKQQEETK